MTCGEYVENMLIFAQYSTHILSNQQLVTSTVICDINGVSETAVFPKTFCPRLRDTYSPPLACEDCLVEDCAVGAEKGDPARAAALVQADVVPLAAKVGVRVVTWRINDC